MHRLDAIAAKLGRKAYDGNWVGKGMLRIASCTSAETRNKLTAFHFFRNPDLYVPITGDWTSQIAACRERTPFESIWLMEGIAGRIAEAMNIGVSLRDCAEVPAEIEETTMALHTGAAAVLARKAVENDAVAKFLEEAEDIAFPGYRRCLVEALGLVVRNLHPERLAEVSQQSADHSEEDYLLFWHGCGRGFYFNPLQMTPFAYVRRKSFERTVEAAPCPAAAENVIAGFVWAKTLVNIERPEILEKFLNSGFRERWIEHDSAIENGVESAKCVWRHLTQNEPSSVPIAEIYAYESAERS